MRARVITTQCLIVLLGCISAIVTAPTTLAQISSDAPTGVMSTSVVPNPRIPRPTLTPDSEGEAVVELQALLNLLGFYTGPISGRYGNQTQAAVQNFQTAAGLTPDGIVGPATWSRLLPAPEEEVIPPSQSATGEGPQSSDPTESAQGPPSPSDADSAVNQQPLLRLGMEGDAVAQLQRRLANLGYYQGPVDGIFGAKTEAAVKAAQENFNLTPDGIVGPDTWAALSS